MTERAKTDVVLRGGLTVDALPEGPMCLIGTGAGYSLFMSLADIAVARAISRKASAPVERTKEDGS